MKARAIRVVWLELEGEPRPFPQCPADPERVVPDFIKWQSEQNVYRALHAGSAGGGRWSGAFTETDFKRVRQYLRNAHGLHVRVEGVLRP